MSSTQRMEWATVALTLLGCAAVTVGVICLQLAKPLAYVLIIAGAAAVVVGAAAWTAVVKAAARRSGRTG